MKPKAFNEDFLPEMDGHKVYFAQYGNPDGAVIVTLHGGPGSSSKSKHIEKYELDKFHVIAFDQRGCGKSTPAGGLNENTTQKLIEDMERLREHLKVKKWFVSGGSWGAALALAYAEKNPDKVRGLLISSVFLANKRAIKWSISGAGGVERMFPDVWEERMKFYKRHNVSLENAPRILLEKLTSGTEEVVKDIVAGVTNWESNLYSPIRNVLYKAPEDVEEKDIAGVKVFLHYEANDFFLEDDQILNDLKKIKAISAIIVHGRYDALCPLEQTWAIKNNMDNVEVVILPSSGHQLSAEAEVAKTYAFRCALKDWTQK